MKGRYNIIAGGRVIGTSDLEERDPSMGTARGRFVPCDAYVSVRPVFRIFAIAQRDTGGGDRTQMEAYYRERDKLRLDVETADGQSMAALVVHIEDYQEIADDAIEVEVHFTDRRFFDG